MQQVAALEDEDPDVRRTLNQRVAWPGLEHVRSDARTPEEVTGYAMRSPALPDPGVPGSPPTPEAVTTFALDRMLTRLGGRAATIVLLAEGGEIELLQSARRDESTDEPFVGAILDEPSPLHDALRARRPILLETPAEIVASYPRLATGRDGAIAALAAMPFFLETGSEGVICATFSESRRFTAGDQSTMRSLIVEYMQALREAKLAEAEQEARAEAEALLAVTAGLGDDADPQIVLRTLVEQAARLVRADAGAYAIRREPGLTVPAQWRRGEWVGELPIASGILSHAARTGKPFRGVDPVDDAHTNRARDVRYGRNSQLAAPLLGPGGECLGVIALANSRRPSGFRGRDERILIALCQVGAIALRRANDRSHELAAEQHAARQAREVAALLAAAGRLNSAVEPEQVLLQVVEIAAELLAVERVAIATNEGDHALRRYTWDAGTWQATDVRLPLEGSISGWVIQHALPYRSDDLSAALGIIDGRAAEPRFKTLLTVPILARDGHVLGALNLHEPRAGGIFTDNDQRLAQGIAHHAAIALERAQLTSDLRRSEERFRSLVQNSSDIITVIDPTGRIRYASPAVESVLGYRTEDWVGREVLDFVHPDDREHLQEAFRRELARARPDGRIELRARHLNGSWRYLDVALSNRLQDAGVQGIVINARDVSERKRAETLLHQQYGYLGALHETALALMNRLDRDELLDAIVARAAALLDAPHGYVYLAEPDQQTMISTAGVGLFHDRLGLRASYGEGIAGRVWQTGEPLAVANYSAWPGRLPSLSGDPIRAMIGCPLTSGGEVVGTIGLARLEENRPFHPHEIALLTGFAQLASLALDNAALYSTAQRDLAERARVEQELVARTHALEAKTASQEAFVYSVSHGLKTPLASILATAELLEDQAGPRLDVDDRFLLQRLHSNSQRLKGLIDDLLSLARAQTSRADLQHGPTCLSDVLQTVQVELSTQIASRDVELTIAPSLPTVTGHHGRLAEVFTNLIDNAIKYTPIERTPVVHIGARAEADWVECWVEDNGAGIPVSQRSRAFELFRRLGDADEARPAGNGVGLAIVARIIEQHGGRIWIEGSSLGGSSFRFVLPRVMDESPSAAARRRRTLPRNAAVRPHA